MPPIARVLHINVPFRMLAEGYLDRFVGSKFNPEIYFGPEDLEERPWSAFEETARVLRDAGLSVTFHAPFMDLSVASPDPGIRAVSRRRYEQVLDLVPVFSPKNVVCHTGFDHKHHDEDLENWTQRSLDFWTGFGKALSEAGGRLMLEHVFETHPEDMKSLFDALPEETAGLCLDTGHMTVFSKAPLTQWLEVWGERIGHLHLHDNYGRVDNHLAPGRGIADFDTLFRYLKARPQAPPVMTIEPHQEGEVGPAFAYLQRIWPW